MPGSIVRLTEMLIEFCQAVICADKSLADWLVGSSSFSFACASLMFVNMTISTTTANGTAARPSPAAVGTPKAIPAAFFLQWPTGHVLDNRPVVALEAAGRADGRSPGEIAALLHRASSTKQIRREICAFARSMSVNLIGFPPGRKKRWPSLRVQDLSLRRRMSFSRRSRLSSD